MAKACDIDHTVILKDDILHTVSVDFDNGQTIIDLDICSACFKGIVVLLSKYEDLSDTLKLFRMQKIHQVTQYSQHND